MLLFVLCFGDVKLILSGLGFLNQFFQLPVGFSFFFHSNHLTHQVGGKKCLNNEVKPLTIALEKFPVSRAKFVANECQILIGSVYPTFVTYDMTASKVIKHSIKGLETGFYLTFVSVQFIYR